MTSLAFNHTIKMSLMLLLYSVSESQGLGQEEDQFIDPDPQHQLYLADGAFYIMKNCNLISIKKDSNKTISPVMFICNIVVI